MLAASASAKVGQESPYTYEQIFGTALRLLRVDLDFKVTEKDADWGYLLFEYQSSETGKRRPRGAFQFVRAEDKVHVWLELPSLPAQQESAMLRRLTRKLEEEHGAPPRRDPARKEAPARESRGEAEREGAKDAPPGPHGH